jgi:hypothetical protein
MPEPTAPSRQAWKLPSSSSESQHCLVALGWCHERNSSCLESVGRRSIANKPIQGGLWHSDTPENRETLIIVMESGNESYGPDSHWIEERQA